MPSCKSASVPAAAPLEEAEEAGVSLLLRRHRQQRALVAVVVVVDTRPRPPRDPGTTGARPGPKKTRRIVMEVSTRP